MGARRSRDGECAVVRTGQRWRPGPLIAPAAAENRLAGTITLLGGTGFVGRALVERWPAGDRARLRVLIHRSTADWTCGIGGEVRPVDMNDDAGRQAALAGSAVVVNLLRPHGDDWLTGTMAKLLSAVAAVGPRLYLHCSSTDIHGDKAAGWITEDAPPAPRTLYGRQHLAAAGFGPAQEFRPRLERYAADLATAARIRGG